MGRTAALLPFLTVSISFRTARSSPMFLSTSTPATQGTEKAPRAWVDDAAAFRTPQSIVGRRLVIVPVSEMWVPGDRSKTLHLWYLFGHDTEYKPNIFPKQVQALSRSTRSV